MDGGDVCSADAKEKTSDFYETHNLPARFECPDEHWDVVRNPLYVDWPFTRGLQNYSKTRRTPTNPFYATTYNDYGYFPPTVHTVRKCYHGKPQRFGQEQFVRGMYRDNSLNM